MRERISRPVAAALALALCRVDVPPMPALRTRAGDFSVHVHRKGGVDHGPTAACADL